MDSSSVEEPLVKSGYTTTRGRYARGDRVCNKYVGSQYYRVLSTRCTPTFQLSTRQSILKSSLSSPLSISGWPDSKLRCHLLTTMHIFEDNQRCSNIRGRSRRFQFHFRVHVVFTGLSFRSLRDLHKEEEGEGKQHDCHENVEHCLRERGDRLHIHDTKQRRAEDLGAVQASSV